MLQGGQSPHCVLPNVMWLLKLPLLDFDPIMIISNSMVILKTTWHLGGHKEESPPYSITPKLISLSSAQNSRSQAIKLTP
jgi:hypothetical protein